MTLADFKPLAKRSLSSVVDAFDRLGLTPNQVSLVSFVFALAGSALFYFASDFGAYAYVGASVLVAVSGILDVVDGELARKIGGGEGTRKGDFLDHTLDRYSDMSIIIGVAGGVGEWVVGVFALTGTFLTSYMGTQAQAVGAGRDYGGVLGRADRVALVLVGGLLHGFVSSVGGFGPLGWVLVVFAVVGNLTAVQRFVATWRNLS